VLDRATQEDKRMADSPDYAEGGGDSLGESGRASAPPTPRWVKVSGILALIVVALLVVMLIAGGGQHGPGRHALGGGQQQQKQPGGQQPGGKNGRQMPSDGGAEGHTPPSGGQ